MAESVVKKIGDEELDDLVNIVANAYPGLKLFSEEARQKYRQRLKEGGEDDPTVNLYGLYRDGKMVGGMRLFDFTMKLLSAKTMVGGVGMVAVDLLHKKEGVAKDLIRFFLDHYRERGAPMALLYPFRPDFYKQMGFGYGTKMSQYRVKPDHLPKTGSKAGVAYLTKADQGAGVECYNRFMERGNGLFEKKPYELKGMFENPEMRVVGYRQPGGNETLAGYMVFHFKSLDPDNFVRNNIMVRELVYHSSEALMGLLKFLQVQADQINEIVFTIQDENLHYLFHDPRNGTNNLLPPISHESNVQGLGIMYRVINTRKLFETLADHNFGGENCRLKLTLEDSFLPENAGSTILHFKNGLPRLSDNADDYEVEIKLDVSDFSSLVMGAVEFKTLYRYGLVSLSDSRYAATLNRLFRAEEKPVCTTPF